MLVSLTVGKVDAGVTVLLTPDKRLIEFPSILLPPDISSGSIVDIQVARNKSSEQEAEQSFRALQEQIFKALGAAEPVTPRLRCRNATQTSVVLEWDPIELATADLISLSMYRNGQKAGTIPKPTMQHSTKISGLAVDTEYAFHLVLRTTAGTYASERVVVRTHKMTDLSGITITTGILPPAVRESLVKAVDRIGAKLVDNVRIDTTHFVTTEGRGVQWEKANEMNIPVVRPEWVDACERTGRILGVTKFYLDAVRIGGPPTTTTTPVEVERPGTAGSGGFAPQAQQQQPPREKELPPQPPSNGASADAAGSATNKPQPPVPEQDSDDESGSEDDSAEDSETVVQEDKVRQDEQKVRADEREEQGLASRPKPTVEEASDEEGGQEDEKEDSTGEKGGKSPGDGASFQDVAL